jgi:hypothetical protein
MKTYHVEVFSDWGQVRMPSETVEASSFSTTAARAIKMAKPFLRKRGSKKMTVRMTVLRGVSGHTTYETESHLD